jgi:hypothetical protein
MREKRGNAKAAGTVAGATVNRAFTTLKLLCNFVQKSGSGVRNPTESVEFLPTTSGRLRVESFDEKIVHLAKASQPLRDIPQVILDTGLRQ